MIALILLRACELVYKYFLRYENLVAERNQLLKDSGITGDLQLWPKHKTKWLYVKIVLNGSRRDIKVFVSTTNYGQAGIYRVLQFYSANFSDFSFLGYNNLVQMVQDR